jgi:sulfoxide reductase catalytic subunit YedY
MLIRNRKAWEIPEAAVTSEAFVLGRREFLGAASAAAIAGATFSAGEAAAAAAAPPPDPSAGLYPFERNATYAAVDRPITAENIITNYNNFCEFGFNPRIARAAQALPIRPWQISITGLVEKEMQVDIDTLIRAMPMEERVYRHRCVEAWSFVAPWSGFPMSALVEYCKPTAAATYVVMKTFMNRDIARQQRQIQYPWPYTEGLTMAEAKNELAFMVTGAYGKPLAKQNGAPLRLAVPWKYGFKSVKSIREIIFTNERPKTFWELADPGVYGFWANVNPDVPHPRWSQESEKPLGTRLTVPTLLYNGYGEQVARLYAGMAGEALFK